MMVSKDSDTHMQISKEVMDFKGGYSISTSISTVKGGLFSCLKENKTKTPAPP